MAITNKLDSLSLTQKVSLLEKFLTQSDHEKRDLPVDNSHEGLLLLFRSIVLQSGWVGDDELKDIFEEANILIYDEQTEPDSTD